MNREYIIFLILLLIIIFLSVFFYPNHKESFIDMTSQGEILNPFDEPDQVGFVKPKKSPPPKPKCCPKSVPGTCKPCNCPAPKVIKVESTCSKPPESTCSKPPPQETCKKEYTCPPCLKTDCPPCPKLECPPCKPCQPVCPSPAPDLSRYVLKSSIPPCPILPDMSNYILKSEIPACPPLPDMSKYVLKTSIPPQTQCPPCPSCPQLPDVNVCDKLLKLKDKDCGVCPPCPRVKCPKPKLECKQVNRNSNNGNNSNVNNWDNQTNNNLEVKLNGKYYTESEIEDIVKKRISENTSGRAVNNTNNCTPRPYEASDLQNPLFNSELTGAKI